MYIVIDYATDTVIEQTTSHYKALNIAEVVSQALAWDGEQHDIGVLTV